MRIVVMPDKRTLEAFLEGEVTFDKRIGRFVWKEDWVRDTSTSAVSDRIQARWWDMRKGDHSTIDIEKLRGLSKEWIMAALHRILQEDPDVAGAIQIILETGADLCGEE